MKDTLNDAETDRGIDDGSGGRSARKSGMEVVHRIAGGEEVVGADWSVNTV